MTIEYDCLSNMVTEAGQFISDQGETRAVKFRNSINKWYMWSSRKFRWSSLMINKEATTISASTNILYLDKWIEKIFFLHNKDLDVVALRWAIENFFQVYPQSSDVSGILTDFSEAGDFARKTDFSSTPEKLSVVSDDAADSNILAIRGLNSSGSDEIQEELTLSGTSSVETTNTYSEIFAIGSTGAQSGVVTISGKDSLTTYATMSPGERGVRYRAYRLRNTPDTLVNIRYYGKKRVNRLIYDSDIPEIPVSQVLVELCLMDHFAQQRKWNEAALFHRQNATEIMDTLTSDIQDEDKIEIPLPVARSGGIANRRRGGGGGGMTRDNG